MQLWIKILKANKQSFVPYKPVTMKITLLQYKTTMAMVRERNVDILTSDGNKKEQNGEQLSLTMTELDTVSSAENYVHSSNGRGLSKTGTHLQR